MLVNKPHKPKISKSCYTSSTFQLSYILKPHRTAHAPDIRQLIARGAQEIAASDASGETPEEVGEAEGGGGGAVDEMEMHSILE